MSDPVDSTHSARTGAGVDPASVLLLAGLLLLLSSMVAGEIFAFFISHHFNADINALWLKVLENAAAGRLSNIEAEFAEIRTLAIGRGGVLSFHAHVGGLGLLCGALAVAMERTGFRFRHDLASAAMFVFGAAIHAGGILLGYLTELQTLGFAHLGSVLMVVALGAASVAVLGSQSGSRSVPATAQSADDSVLTDDSQALGTAAWHRLLVHAGAFLVVASMLFGIYLAASHMFGEEPRLNTALAGIFHALHAADAAGATALFQEFKTIQTRMAITTAAHTHAASFGLLMIILGLMAHRLSLPRSVRRTGVVLMTVGAFALPVFVYLAPRYGFGLAMGANTSGALVLVGTLMLTIGVVTGMIRRGTKQ